MHMTGTTTKSGSYEFVRTDEVPASQVAKLRKARRSDLPTAGTQAVWTGEALNRSLDVEYRIAIDYDALRTRDRARLERRIAEIREIEDSLRDRPALETHGEGDRLADERADLEAQIGGTR